jgi:hypothetical protein
MRVIKTYVPRPVGPSHLDKMMEFKNPTTIKDIWTKVVAPIVDKTPVCFNLSLVSLFIN